MRSCYLHLHIEPAITVATEEAQLQLQRRLNTIALLTQFSCESSQGTQNFVSIHELNYPTFLDSLHKNNIGVEGASALAEALKQNSTLKLL